MPYTYISLMLYILTARYRQNIIANSKDDYTIASEND